MASDRDSSELGRSVCTHLLPLAECVSLAQYPPHNDESFWPQRHTTQSLRMIILRIICRVSIQTHGNSIVCILYAKCTILASTGTQFPPNVSDVKVANGYKLFCRDFCRMYVCIDTYMGVGG